MANPGQLVRKGCEWKASKKQTIPIRFGKGFGNETAKEGFEKAWPSIERRKE